MKYWKILVITGLVIFSSCKPDDEDDVTSFIPRDTGEVYLENLDEIETYLETHFFYVEETTTSPIFKRIVFDTIAGDNAGETPIMESEFLLDKTVTLNDIDYKLYYLKVREGNSEEYKPTFADRTIVGYRGQNIDEVSSGVFDESIVPLSFDLPGTGNGGVIPGFSEGLVEFRGAGDQTDNGDGTFSYSDDYGLGAIFIPSGLGYYAAPPSGSIINLYDPLIFSFQLYKAIQQDHDGDGIPSIFEDLDGDEVLFDEDDDSDNDGAPNYLDADDDNDGVLTINEIEVNDANEDGVITLDEINFIDSDNDGTPDYLDSNFPE
jgi:hypothetical protein